LKDGERGRNRTFNLLIKSSEAPITDREDKELSSAESGRILQNPQLPRNNEYAPNPVSSNSGKSQTKPQTEQAELSNRSHPPLSGMGPHEK
jgi:hypothetical protein